MSGQNDFTQALLLALKTQNSEDHCFNGDKPYNLVTLTIQCQKS